jgi:threonine dehydrogenase-like Zn-dependent dehydrogenase
MWTLPAPKLLELVDVPTPMPGAHEIRIRVQCVGLCGSDMEIFDGIREPKLIWGKPTLGHEMAGTIDIVGEHVSGLTVGDRVTCVEAWGALAEYVVARPTMSLRIPARLDMRDACLLEALPGIMMVARRTRVSRQSDVLVVGQGLSGLLLTRVLSLQGCRRLCVVDRSKANVELAREFGATEGIVGPIEQSHEILHASQPDGFDCIIVATRQASFLADLVAHVRERGCILLYGGLEPSIHLDLYALHRRSISLLKEGMDVDGILEARRLWHEALQLAADGVLPLKRLRTHVLSMWRAPEAFAIRSDPAVSAIHVVLTND